MTTPDPEDVLGEDEIRISVGPAEAAAETPEAAPGKPDAFQPHVLGLSRRRAIQKVKISDDELESLRKQVQRIAGKLEASTADDRFAVDSVTLHVGVTATGTFVWASAGVEVAVDVTWRRRQPTQAPA